MADLAKNRKRLIKIVAFLALLVSAAAIWTAAAPIRGRMAAHYDVWRGHYKILLYGLPTADRPEYVRLLKERYRVQSIAVAGCIVSPSLVAYVDNYDEIVSAAADKKFGHDIFKECSDDAEKSLKHHDASAALM